MAQINKQQLKDYFRRGNKPTESQFEDLIDSNINVVSSKITIDNDLNIGLDVDNPQAKLHVNGSLQLEQKTDYTGAKGTVRWTGSDLVVKTENEDTSDSWKSLVDTSGTVSIDEYNNRIGIGLTEQSPLSRLHLNGPVRIDNPTEHINKAMLNVLGSVGIGTDHPESNLHIAATYNQALSGTVTGTQGDTKLTGTATLFNSELQVGQKIQIDTHSYTINSITSDTNLTLNKALVENATDATVYITGDLLKVQDINNTTSLEIDKNGNVGIGTTSPGEKLEVNGKVKATSFEGNGASLTNLDASNITGEIALVRLPQGIQNLVNLVPQIGQERSGGIVFKVNPDGISGLVCATGDQETFANWDACKTSCENHDGEGYSDWRMPTKKELNDMYENLHKHGIGGFAGAWYWSSTENRTSNAWVQFFSNGNQAKSIKSNDLRVRAVRVFNYLSI